MYAKYSVGFLIGSLVQAGIVLSAEAIGISRLGARLTLGQLALHILAGQAAGYILLLLLRKVETIQKWNTTLTGAVWGLIVWAIVIPINAVQGKVRLPWEAGIGTILASSIAFIVFGIITAYTIKHYGYEGNLA